jgi:hypothetical protein
VLDTEKIRVARFFLAQPTETEKLTIIPPNIPNNIYPIAIKYTNTFHSKALKNIPKFGFFGMKIYPLATLEKRTILKRRKFRNRSTFARNGPFPGNSDSGADSTKL